ncbi:hypothetical protein EYF80_006400 [Liparis tanakae]|uniref:Uncharacterized protein n=1 Tax=Liparis tanakae TaxID=230148 RepID=A0A4Z2IZJ1_9TELE|nr:hypothetical protein EYF80_006400 [Liparis tanakae]
MKTCRTLQPQRSRPTRLCATADRVQLETAGVTERRGHRALVSVVAAVLKPESDLSRLVFFHPVTMSSQLTGLVVKRGVDEQVGGLEVTVQHVGRVDVLEASQDLVEEIADVVVAQPLGLQQLVQVRVAWAHIEKLSLHGLNLETRSCGRSILRHRASRGGSGSGSSGGGAVGACGPDRRGADWA